MTPDPFERFSRPLVIAAFLVFLAVYVPTLYPSVPGGDSGELIVAAHRLGVAHPPGYPLFTLLGKLFTLIPAGTIAWRVNLLTAALSALASTVLLRAAWRLTGNPGAGILAGGLFAFSPLVWRYAVQAEVFSLNNLFVAVLLLLLVRFVAEPDERKLGWFCLCFGLGLTNHHTLMFVGVPIGAWMFWRAPRSVFSWPRILRWPILAALGLLPYMYLLVSPADHPSATWGDTGTLSGFWAHLTRAQYGTFQLGTMEQGGSLGERLLAWLAQLPGELLWAGPLLALVAVGWFGTRKSGEAGPRSVVAVAGAALAFYLLVFGAMTRISLEDPFWLEVYARFWQQANLVVCLLAGVGLAVASRSAGPRASIVALAVAVAAVGAQVAVHFPAQNHGRDRLVADVVRAALDGLPQGALLVSKGDLYWNGLRYQQVCEGLRPDVRLLDVELLKAPWMSERVKRHLDGVKLPGRVYRAPSRRHPDSYDLAALFEANAGRFPILSNALEHGDSSWKERFASWSEGLFERVVSIPEPFDVDAWLARTDGWVAKPVAAPPGEIPDGSWERVAWEEYGKAESRRGTRILAEIIGGKLDRRYAARAAEILQRAARRRDSDAVYLNLGISYYLQRETDPRALDAMVAAWRRFLELTPPDDPRRPLVERVLADPDAAEIGIGSM